MRDVHIVAALLRRHGELLMVLQGEPGEEPHWSIPAGRVDPGEFVTDALARELREETGLEATDPGTLAFLAQVDDRADAFFATVWTWELVEWRGELAPADPDGLIRDVAWKPLPEALAHLDRIGWQLLTARYLRGEVEPGSLWLRRVHEDGRVALQGFGGVRATLVGGAHP